MKTPHRVLVLGASLVVAVAFAACAPQAAAPTSAPAAPVPTAAKAAATTAPAAPAATAAPKAATTKKIVIGFTASNTGGQNLPSKKQIEGLQLWLDDVTKAGGIKLKDGTALLPEMKFYATRARLTASRRSIPS